MTGEEDRATVCRNFPHHLLEHPLNERIEPVRATAERFEELARMLGGIEITDTSRQHAREMLERGTEDRAAS